VRDIVIPAYLVNTGAAVAGLVVGSLAAWYETGVLLGGVPVGGMLTGIALGALFLAFAVALTAGVASVVRGVVATAGVTLACLLGLAIVGGLTPLGRWLPTRLSGAMTELVRGASVADYAPAVVTSLAGTAVLVAGAVVLGGRREL
jgi:ABC-2 type transport system permease protein